MSDNKNNTTLHSESSKHKKNVSTDSVQNINERNKVSNTNTSAQNDSYKNFLDEKYEIELETKKKADAARYSVNNNGGNRYTTNPDSPSEHKGTQKIGNAKFMQNSTSSSNSGGGGVNKAYAITKVSDEKPKPKLSKDGQVHFQPSSSYVQETVTRQAKTVVKKVSRIPTGDSYSAYNDPDSKTSSSSNISPNNPSKTNRIKDDTYQQYFSQLYRNKTLESIRGDKVNAFKKLYPMLGSIGMQMSGVQSLKETDAYQGYKEISIYAAPVVHAIVGSGYKSLYKTSVDKNISRLVGNADVYQKGFAELRNIGVRSSKKSIRNDRNFGQTSKSKILAQIKKYSIETGMEDLSRMNVKSLKQFIAADNGYTEAQKDVARLALKLKDTRDFTGDAGKRIMQNAGMDIRGLSFDLTSTRNKKAILARMSKEFMRQGSKDYTLYSAKQLKNMLKNNEIGAEQKEAVEFVRGLKNTNKSEKRMNQANSKKGFDALRIAQKTFAGADAFDGAMLIYRSTSGVKSALILANTIRKMTGKVLMKAYKITGAQEFTQAVIRSIPKLTKLQTKTNSLKQTITTKAKERTEKKTEKRAKRNVKNKIKNKIRKTAIYKKLSNTIAFRAMQKLFSPVILMKTVFAKLSAFFAKAALYAGLGFLVLAVVISTVTAIMGAISSTFVYSESADMYTEEDPTKSELYKLVEDLWNAESTWTEEIADIEGIKPSKILKDYWIDEEKSHPAPWAGKNEVVGYYNPNSKNTEEIKKFGIDAGSDENKQNGYYTMYFNGQGIGSPDNAIAKYQNLKMCISLAHVFVGMEYDKHEVIREDGTTETVNCLDEFKNYAKILWFSSHKIEPVISEVYSCEEGCEVYEYKCNEEEAYNLNTTDPNGTNYTCLKEALYPQTTDGCVKKYHVNNSDNNDWGNFPVGTEITNGVGKNIGTHTESVYYGGNWTPDGYWYNYGTLNLTLTNGCSLSNCVWKSEFHYCNSSYCDNQKLVNSLKCSGCQHKKVYHGIYTYGSDTYWECYNSHLLTPEELEDKGLNPEKYGDYYECGGNCNAVYCPGNHTANVCLGHAKCQGHATCPGHTVKICTGHVNVDVKSTIMGITKPEILPDGTEVYKVDKSLFNGENPEFQGTFHRYPGYDSLNWDYFNYEAACKKVGFEGWDDDNIELALSTYEADWYDLYGIEFSKLQGTALEGGEIATITSALNLVNIDKHEAEVRSLIVTHALESVAKIPYYWGGVASGPGYEDNEFGKIIEGDTKGRTGKGLDCSHWVDWVYWTIAGDNLGNGNTVTLASSSKLKTINRDDLKPGDVLLLNPYNEDAHAGIFIGWLEDGKMLYAHETGGTRNNVVVESGEIEWTMFRTYIDFAKVTLPESTTELSTTATN